eukprot:2986654-Rhodomonas_salina.1
MHTSLATHTQTLHKKKAKKSRKRKRKARERPAAADAVHEELGELGVAEGDLDLLAVAQRRDHLRRSSIPQISTARASPTP